MKIGKLKFGFKNPLQLKNKSIEYFKNLQNPNKRNWKKIGKIAAYVSLGLLLFLSILFAWFAKDLPTSSKIASMKTAQSTKIFDRNGVLLYETGELKRTLITSDQMPQNIKNATVAVEDQSFYQNHGLDFKGIARAAFRDIFRIGSGRQGGSTITQQYVKNALLYSDQTIARKIKEAILSIELEFMYSKDQILTMYLNEIPYGGQSAGIEAASQMYYGKSAKDLSLAQAATLAAIPQAPTYYSPYGSHTEKLINRRNYVLNQMVEMKYITQEEADKAKQEDTTTVGTAVQKRKMSMLAPHFAMYVLEQASAEFGEQRAEKEGLSIYTSLDYEKQKVAEQAVTDGMAKVGKYGGSNGSLVAIDPKTGEILAMVGSKDFFDTEIDGNVNVSTSLRQPGSSFKPYVYATAFKRTDFSPSKTLFDVTTDFGNYTPRNYDNKTHGALSARTALSNSLNIPAVKTTAIAEIENVITTASDMGITSLTDTDRYGLSLGLGVGEVTLLEHTNGFATFANNSIHHELHPMLKVVDTSGKTIYEYKPEEDKGNQSLDPQIAYEIQSILSDNGARSMVFGTRTPLNFSDRQVAAKTGTTNDFRDAWTMGFTPSIAVGVWVGNNDNTSMSSGADGVVVAAPIFRQFMLAATATTTGDKFVAPEGIQTLTVEKYSNKLPTEYSKETVTDIFASWQIPKDKDDVNAAVKVCKSNGLLAPSGASDNVTEVRIFSNIHSEKPTSANWENPVRSWATASGLYNPVPTETCSLGSSISVDISAPSADQTVSGNVAFVATTSSPSDTYKVDFYLDNQSIGSDNTSPYSIAYDVNILASGRHVLKVVATGNNGASDTKEVSFFSLNGNFTISNVSVSSITSSTALITWSTSISGTSQVFYDTSSHNNYSDYLFSSTKKTSFTTNHSVNLSSLSPSTTYNYRVVSTDSGGGVINSNNFTFKTSP